MLFIKRHSRLCQFSIDYIRIYQSTIDYGTRKIPISNNECLLLLDYIQQDLNTIHKQASAFGLLRQIIDRKILLSQVYIDRINHHIDL